MSESVASTATFRSRANLTPLLLVSPSLLFMLVFYALPVLTMLLRSVAEPTWTLENYAALAGDTVFLHVFWTTLRTAVAVTMRMLCWATRWLWHWCGPGGLRQSLSSSFCCHFGPVFWCEATHGWCFWAGTAC